MDALLQDIERFGGALQRGRLRELGHDKHRLQRAMSAGRLIGIGRKWVTLPTVPGHILTAISLRGRVAAATALETYGVWVTHNDTVWLAVSPGSHYVPLPKAVKRIECRFEVDHWAPWRVSLLDALAQYCRRTSRNDAVAAIDSALHLRLLKPRELDQLAAKLPRHCRSWLRRANGDAESGLESILRLACEDQGWDVAIQVRFRGGRVDLVIDGWLFVEVDGSQFHDVGSQAKKDRLRNTQLVQSGYRWHRCGYADVVHRLDETVEVLRTILRHGRPQA